MIEPPAVSASPAAPEFTMRPTTLAALASRHGGLQLCGPDREIVAFGTLATRSQHRDQLLTYAASDDYLADFVDSGIAACVMPRVFARDLPANVSALTTETDPRDTFFALFAETIDEGRWHCLTARQGSGNSISPSAQIHDGVIIGDDCIVMDCAVLLQNTQLGDRVLVKPHATIGGQGFQVGTIDGRRTLIPHVGGVFLGDDVAVGSQTCIDRGLFGELTTVGARTMIDNLVHIAHSASLGMDATVVACAEVSGSVGVGDGAWLGPSCAINPGVTVGDHALIGTGSTVVKDIPPHALAYGVPARVAGWRCRCGSRLQEGNSMGRCSTCGTRYQMHGPYPVAIDDDA